MTGSVFRRIFQIWLEQCMQYTLDILLSLIHHMCDCQPGLWIRSFALVALVTLLKRAMGANRSFPLFMPKSVSLFIALLALCRRAKAQRAKRANRSFALNQRRKTKEQIPNPAVCPFHMRVQDLWWLAGCILCVLSWGSCWLAQSN